MKTNILKSTTLSLVTIALLGFTGCGSSSSDDNSSSTTPAGLFKVAGKAVDGYIAGATVCLDLSQDGVCASTGEATTTTDADGDYSLDITQEMKDDANYSTAPILVYGGKDIDTGKAFDGKLTAPFDESKTTNTTANLTPVTTMVETLMSENNVSLAEAESKVKDMLDLDASTNLGADPIALADANKTDLLAGALKLQKSIEVLASGLSGSDTTANIEAIYSDMATQIEAGNVSDLTSTLTSTANANAKSVSDLLENAKALTTKIDTLVANAEASSGEFNSSFVGKTVDTMQTSIENNTSLDKVDLTMPEISNS